MVILSPKTSTKKTAVLNFKDKNANLKLFFLMKTLDTTLNKRKKNYIYSRNQALL